MLHSTSRSVLCMCFISVLCSMVHCNGSGSVQVFSMQYHEVVVEVASFRVLFSIHSTRRCV